MKDEQSKSRTQPIALPESKKQERRAAMAEIKRLHADDPAGAREAARLWFEQNAAPLEAEALESSSFHQRKLSEADPERSAKAAEALKKSDAAVEQAQSASRGAVKEWRKKNPNKVKKLNNLYREQLKTTKKHK